MKSSVRLFRIAEIDIGIHYTWIFIFLLISLSLAQGFFPRQYPGWDTVTYWITGVIAALALFVSVLLHELAHSLVARARGMSVNSITLFIFGGVSNLEEEPEKPKTEFAMAIVGPLTSLVLAAVFWGLLQTISNQDAPLPAMLGYLALVNLILAIFNFLPGFPLDGGRVLRSILWGTMGSLRKATNISATIGRFFGWGLIALGVLQMLFAGDFLGGIWIAFIGWFISNAADASRMELTLREHLSGVQVKDVMRPVETISPDATVEEVVLDIFRMHRGRAVPVCQDSKTVGIITVTDVKELPREKWAKTAVAKIMTQNPLYTVSPDDSLQTAMKLISEHDINQVLVNQQGQCAGLISRADIISHIQLSQELRIESSISRK
ncbi:MAG: site-2 protease family protein [Dehalococcoidales bacterium]|nr:site-2 protease family protein [Dehalococcoidales bacterium]